MNLKCIVSSERISDYREEEPISGSQGLGVTGSEGFTILSTCQNLELYAQESKFYSL